MDIKSSVYSELNHTYEPIPDSIPDFEDDPATAESNSISGHIQDTQITKKQKWKNPIAILIIIQMLILIVLASSHIVLNYSQMVRCPDGPKPPYCMYIMILCMKIYRNNDLLALAPLYEDNAVQYINQKMHPQRIFQSESSTIVDAAWEEPLEGKAYTKSFSLRRLAQ